MTTAGILILCFCLSNSDYLACPSDEFMNTKLLLKTVFLIAVLLLLVLMGMSNTQPVELRMALLLPRAQRQPAALMYFGFFALGVLSGTVLTAGSKGGKSSGKSKPEK